MPFDYDEVLQRLIEHLKPRCPPALTLNENVDLIEGVGLDSNGVLEMLMEVEDEFDISVPVNQLVDVHTIGDLARRIEAISQKQP